MKTHLLLLAAISLLFTQGCDGGDTKPSLARIAGKYYSKGDDNETVELRENGTFSISSAWERRLGNSCCKNGTYSLLADGKVFFTPDDGGLMFNYYFVGADLHGEGRVYQRR